MSAASSSESTVALFESLSMRAQEVFAALANSMIEREVADTLGISPNTVHGYVKRIYAVMRIHSRQDLIAIVRSDAAFRERIQTIARALKPRDRPARPHAEPADVEITVRIERPVLAALGRHIDNLPRHLAELARREAVRLSTESAPSQ
jgi:DNA-binding CsgD family transcriptional regulator